MKSWIEPYRRFRDGRSQHVRGHWRRSEAEIKQSLTSLEEDFEEIAAEFGQRNFSPTSQMKATRIQKVAVVTRLIVDNFLDWMVAHSPNIGRVLAHFGLATAITAAIVYIAGVNATTTFLITLGALNGKNIWDVIKLFASKKD
jgi:hypothetical protein